MGDIGDNDAVRDSVTVARVPVGRGDRTVDAPTYELVYPDGARDAETLLADPDGRLLVVTKGIFGGEVLRAPRRLDPDRPNRLRAVGTAPGIATDGAFFPDGRHVVIRTYTRAAVYTYPALDEVGSFALPRQPQGEGIAVAADGAVFVSTEGAGTAVTRVRLPARVRVAVADAPTPTPTPTPDPTPRAPVTSDPAELTPGPGEDGATPAGPATDPASATATGWSRVGTVLLVLLVLGLAGFVVVSTVVAVVRRRDRPDG